jgi:hypothetical protein
MEGFEKQTLFKSLPSKKPGVTSVSQKNPIFSREAQFTPVNFKKQEVVN